MAQYTEMKKASFSMNEKSDCAVVAIAAACRISYEESHAMLRKNGRRDRDGTYFHQIMKSIEELGFKAVPIAVSHFIEYHYVGRHKACRSVTTHHPKRFPHAFPEGTAYILFVMGHAHVAAVVDGNVVDWTEGRSMQCRDFIYRIEKV